jgi:hypothetical protein
MKILAATLPVCACVGLAFAVTAPVSDASSGDATGPASTSAQTYCAELQQGIGSQTFRFSGWRCKQGPGLRGHQTILGWVKMTEPGGKSHVELLWVAETEPARDAQVIDARKVPRYGYEPTDVRAAFRNSAENHLTA